MNLFYELIQVALGNKEKLSRNPTEKEWHELYAICQKQTVAGIAFFALDKLSKLGQKPPLNLLFEWIGLAEQIKQQNHLLNERCKELQEFFSNAGFRTCILKGQGNALMYPEPLYRQSGDIDIWVEGSKDNIVDFVKKRTPNEKAKYHHIEFPIFKDVMVEVHYMPTFSNVPWYNRRMQSFIQNIREQQFDNYAELIDMEGNISVPTIEFNVVFQMSHLMRHFMSEGIGLRHIMDYYFLLQKLNSEGNNDDTDWEETFKVLGLFTFAKGVMWIEKHVLSLDKNKLIVPPDERIGKFILSEILSSGNFGVGDSRFTKRLISPVSTNMSILVRNLKMIGMFPVDSIFAPITNIWHGSRCK